MRRGPITLGLGLLVTAAGAARPADDLRHLGPDDATGSSKAVVVGDVPLAHTAQFLALDAAGQLVGKGRAAAQAGHVLGNLEVALREAKSGSDKLVKLNVYVARQDVVAEVRKVLAARFAGRAKPAVGYVVTRLPHPDALVAMDAVAVSALDPGRSVKIARGARLPPTVDAHVAVVPPGTRVYVAGQAEKAGGLAEATRKTLESLRATLKHFGQRDADIVQLKAFLKPMADADAVRRELSAFFGRAPVPPVAFVEWESTLPIEIELIAYGGKDRPGDVVEFLTPPGMTASPIYSRVARTNHARSVYVSGLYGAKGPDGAAEVSDVFASLGQTLEQAGSDFRHLVKATYYVSTDDASRKLNELRPRYYDPKRPPSASKAAVAGVGREARGLTVDMIAAVAVTPDKPEYGPAEYGRGLTPADAAEGWLSLFDGKTTFGWQGGKLDGDSLMGGTTTTAFGPVALRADFARGGTVAAGGKEIKVGAGTFSLATTEDGGALRLGEGVKVRTLAVRPLGLQALFNGRDLDGWKRVDRAQIPEERRPKWHVEGGALRAVGGPGAVEYQGGRYGDLVIQIDVRTRVRHANGGLFLRCIPGDFMNGYEGQVYNRGESGDPGRPARWSTAAIDDRQMARRLVSRDGQFFTMTAVARGPRLATWVNGHPLTDWTDTRPPHANPRQGLRTEAGTVQLQAHDAGTDVEFKNIRAAKLP